MPVLEVTVNAKLDGIPLSGFPAIRRAEVAEAQVIDVQKTGGDVSYVSIPSLDAIPAINVLVLRSDGPLGVRLNAQSDSGIVLNRGGMIVLFDVVIDAGAGTNVKVSNTNAPPVTLRGVAAGT